MLGEKKSYLFLLQVVHLRVTNRNTIAGAEQIFLTGLFPAVVLGTGREDLLLPLIIAMILFYESYLTPTTYLTTYFNVFVCHAYK